MIDLALKKCAVYIRDLIAAIEQVTCTYKVKHILENERAPCLPRSNSDGAVDLCDLL